MALYARRGVKGTGLAAIGQAAGVTHAGVLYHFGSSRRLLLAVLDERDRHFSARTAADWEGRGGLDAPPDAAPRALEPTTGSSQRSSTVLGPRSRPGRRGAPLRFVEQRAAACGDASRARSRRTSGAGEIPRRRRLRR